MPGSNTAGASGPVGPLGASRPRGALRPAPRCCVPTRRGAPSVPSGPPRGAPPLAFRSLWASRIAPAADPTLPVDVDLLRGARDRGGNHRFGRARRARGRHGLGRDASRLFASEGAKIVATDIVDTHVKSVADEIQAAGGEATYMKADVTSGADMAYAVAEAGDTFGGLDVM